MQSPPFSIQLLKHDDNENINETECDDEDLLPLMPASYRTENDDLAASSLDFACIKKELALERLDRIIRWLWLAGRPMPPRPLHYQLLLKREIFITEQMDMHLVWSTERMFLKPIPRFLLEPRFWSQHLCCDQGCSCSKAGEGLQSDCERRILWKCSLGFLFSYAGLICYESDFLIAQDKHLLPKEIKWLAWRAFVKQLDTEHIYQRINERFVYGELRLSRLNKITRLSQGRLLVGYMPHWQQYRIFVRDNFTWLASAIAYMIIILTAMQVGLATKTLAENPAFQSASYGFTVFSIFGPAAATGIFLLIFGLIVAHNWMVTLAYKRRRFCHIKDRLDRL